MRYNKRLSVVLQRGQEEYNPLTHRIEKTEDVIKEIPCYLSPISLERSMAIFGAYDKHILVARCQGKPSQEHQEIYIEGQKYKVIKQIDYRHRYELYLEVVR